MLDQLPEPERVIFENPPLVLSVCQVRFSRVLAISERGPILEFHRLVETRYPILESAPVRVEELEFGSNEPIRRRTEDGGTEWRFSDVNDQWAVILSEQSLAIEARHYDRFEDLLARVDEVLGHLVRLFSPKLVRRVGLRYINEIRLPSHDWGFVLRPELLGPLSVKEARPFILRSLQETEFEIEELRAVLRLRHGLLRGGTTVQPRQGQPTPSGPFYLLDFDLFRAFQQGELTLQPIELLTMISAYHGCIERFFHWAITKGYVSSLGVRHDST